MCRAIGVPSLDGPIASPSFRHGRILRWDRQASFLRSKMSSKMSLRCSAESVEIRGLTDAVCAFLES
jgi:hypothetical protein